MNILIFTDNKNIENGFKKLSKNKSITLEILPDKELRKMTKKAEPGTFIYVDIAKYTGQELNKTLTFLSKLEGLLYGIIDSKNMIKDIAPLFHDGASDYISKTAYQEGITAKRLEKILEFKKPELPTVTGPGKTTDYILSGNDWGQIKSGKEYTFCMLFTELDRQKEIRNSFDANHIKIIRKTFEEYIQRHATPFNGRIWMWRDFGGLALIPFDGKNVDAIELCIRLILANKIFSVEEIDFDILFSYRLTLHIGNVPYKKKGDTGEIVSDSINSIFHLGQKFTQPGNFTLPQEVFNFAPEGLKEAFAHVGTFEGREIMQLKMPINH